VLCLVDLRTNRFEPATTTTKPPTPSTYWAVRDLLLAGPYPGAPHPNECRQKLNMFLHSGSEGRVERSAQGPFREAEVRQPCSGSRFRRPVRGSLAAFGLS